LQNTHLKEVKESSLGEVTLLVGDPGRIPRITAMWENVELITENRELILYKGTWRNKPVSICSTGMGVGSTEIAVIELIQSGAKALVRLGGCGAWDDSLAPGDLVVNYGMARDPGMLNAYVKDSYPAVADPGLVKKIQQEAGHDGFRVHLAIGLTTQSYYLGQSRKVKIDHGPQATAEIMDYWKQRNIINCEMETAVIYLLASLYGVPAANCLVVHVNRTSESWVPDQEYAKIHQKVSCVVLNALLFA
jgi:uridine phosphorylase